MSSPTPPAVRPIDALLRAAGVHAELSTGAAADELQPAPTPPDEAETPSAPEGSPPPKRKRGPAAS